MNFISRAFSVAFISVSIFSTGFGQSVVKIMPLGNSITEGWMDGTESLGQRKAYRYELKQLLNTAGYQTDFVGSELVYGCDYFSDCECAGIDGTRDQYIENMLITGYDERWGVQKTTGPYLDAFNPDIILLSIGTNDITHEANAITNQRVSAILNQIDAYELRAGKEVIVFLALIINRRKLPGGGDPVNTYTTSQWNIAINAMAQQRIINGDKLFVVDMENGAGIDYGYTAGDMYQPDPEGLHPGPAGYTKMANKWYSSIMDNYNTPPTISPIPDKIGDEGLPFPTINLNDYVVDIQDADQNLVWTAAQLSTSNLNISINPTTHATTITPKNSEWSGTQTVVFTVTDLGKNGKYIKSSKDTVVFTVNSVNDTPTITGQTTSLSVNEDNPIALNISNFTIFDPDSPSSSFQLTILPGSNYTFSGLIVTPALNFNGNLSVNVAVSDDIAQGPSYAASINVLPVPDNPQFVSQPTITINEDETYNMLLSNLTVTDPDNTPDQLTLTMVNGNNYTIEGTIIKPKPNYNGLLQVESYLSDPQGNHSPTFYLQIQINPVEDLPVFITSPDTSAIIGSSYLYAFSALDSDTTDLVSYEMILKPDWLTYYQNFTILAGVPTINNKGLHMVVIRATDGLGYTDQTFLLRVKSLIPVENIVSKEDVSIYPNPASHEISIAGIPANQNTTFRMYNLIGGLVYSHDFENNFEEILRIDNINLKDGIYFYTIEINSVIISGKLSIVN